MNSKQMPSRSPLPAPGPRAYLALAAAVLLQVGLGGIYAWSALVPPLRAEHGYTTAQYTPALLLSAALAGLGLGLYLVLEHRKG